MSHNNIKNFSYLIDCLNKDQKLIYASSASVYCNTNNEEATELYINDNQELYNYYDMSKKIINNIASCHYTDGSKYNKQKM